MGDTLKIIAVLILIIALAVCVVSCGMKDAEVNHSAFTEPGICPNCGAKLVKGVYGYYTPNFIWYCPDCP